MSLREILTTPIQPWTDIKADSVTSNTSISSLTLNVLSLHTYTDGAIINLPASDIVNGYVSVGTRTGGGGGSLILPLGSAIDTYLGSSNPIGTAFTCLFVANGSVSSSLVASTGCTFVVTTAASNINLGSTRTQTLVYFVKTAANTYVAYC